MNTNNNNTTMSNSQRETTRKSAWLRPMDWIIDPGDNRIEDLGQRAEVQTGRREAAQIMERFNEALQGRRATLRPWGFYTRQHTQNNVVRDDRRLGLPETAELFELGPYSEGGAEEAPSLFVEYRKGVTLDFEHHTYSAGPIGSEELARLRVRELLLWGFRTHNRELASAAAQFLGGRYQEKVDSYGEFIFLKWELPEHLRQFVNDIFAANSREDIIAASERQTDRLLSDPVPTNGWGEAEFAKCGFCLGSGTVVAGNGPHTCPDCHGKREIPLVVAKNGPSRAQVYAEQNSRAYWRPTYRSAW